MIIVYIYIITGPSCPATFNTSSEGSNRAEVPKDFSTFIGESFSYTCYIIAILLWVVPAGHPPKLALQEHALKIIHQLVKITRTITWNLALLRKVSDVFLQRWAYLYISRNRFLSENSPQSIVRYFQHVLARLAINYVSKSTHHPQTSSWAEWY